MKTELLHHWWIYPLAIYYLTWTITYQILLYQNIWKGGGVLGSVGKYMKFLLEGIKEGPAEVWEIFASLIVGVLFLICGAFWLIWWACAFALGFVPFLNNIISSWKTYYDDQDKYFAFEHVHYKETPLIKAWAFFFRVLGVGMIKLLSIRLRKA